MVLLYSKWGLRSKASRPEARTIAFGASGRSWHAGNPVQFSLDRRIQWTQAQSGLDLAIRAERMG